MHSLSRDASRGARRAWIEGRWGKSLLLAGSTVLALAVAEGILRLFFTSPYYYVYTPHAEIITAPDPAVMPGIYGEGRFYINRDGIRGDVFAPDQDVRILALGGSTTECLYLDEAEAWPYRVQHLLNERLDSVQVWVGNAGRAARNTRHHRVQVEKLLGQYPRIDAVMLLVGVNDLTMRLGADDAYVPYDRLPPSARQDILENAFSILPRVAYREAPWYRRLELWNRLKRVAYHVFYRIRWSDVFQNKSGDVHARWRAHRQQAGRIRHDLPDLRAALEEYAHNLEAIIGQVRKHGAEVILITQPVMWRADLPDPFHQWLWLGGVGRFQVETGLDYYSVAALRQGMDRYNETLLAVCRRAGAICIDAAPQIPRDTTAFYDDEHFNERGAALLAQVVVRELLQSSLFTGRRDPQAP